MSRELRRLLGRNLPELRSIMGYSQGDLAELVGATEDDIACCEENSIVPKTLAIAIIVVFRTKALSNSHTQGLISRTYFKLFGTGKADVILGKLIEDMDRTGLLQGKFS